MALFASAALLASCGHHSFTPAVGNGLDDRSTSAFIGDGSGDSQSGMWTGKATLLFTGGFYFNGGSGCLTIKVFTPTGTRIIPSTARVLSGSNVSVIGTGTCTTSIVANTVTVNLAVPKHVLTGDYRYDASGRPWSAYTPYLDWAEVHTGDANGIAAAGIKTIIYSNPNRVFPTDAIYPTDETAFAHTCLNVRIHSNAMPTQYFMDPHSTHLWSLWKNWIDFELAGNHYDAVFDDQAFDFWGISAQPCNLDKTSWYNATLSEIRSLQHPLIYNSLNDWGPNFGMPPAITLNPVAIAGMMEGCYAAKWNPTLSFGQIWLTSENVQLRMAREKKIFFCLPNDRNYAYAAIHSRTFMYASFMMTYDAATSLLWEYYKTTSGFHVEPESKLVPTAPLVAAPLDISGLKDITGNYKREYAACYLGGRLVGACVTIVNADRSGSHALPAGIATKYHHTLVLTGGGVLDGGTIATNGPPPPASIPITTGVIAFP